MRRRAAGESALLPLINPVIQAKYGLAMTSFILENVSVPPEVEQAIDKLTIEKDFPPTSKILIRGQYQVMEASFTSLFGGLLLAIVLVYALLVILFQSWVDPFIIMMAVPGALIAALLIGFVDTFGKVFLPDYSGILVYLLMAVILLWRPEGLFRESAL